MRAYAGGAGKARATRYFSQGPGLYPSLGSTAQGTEKKKEDLAGKRGRGRGEWLRAEREVEVENPLSGAESQPICSAK